MAYLRMRATYGMALWRPTDAQLHRLQSLFLRPLRHLLHLPFTTNAHGLLVDAHMPSFHRYRQSLVHAWMRRANTLPITHPTRHIMQTEQAEHALTRHHCKCTENATDTWNTQSSVCSCCSISSPSVVSRCLGTFTCYDDVSLMIFLCLVSFLSFPRLEWASFRRHQAKPIESSPTRRRLPATHTHTTRTYTNTTHQAQHMQHHTQRIAYEAHTTTTAQSRKHTNNPSHRRCGWVDGWHW